MDYGGRCGSVGVATFSAGVGLRQGCPSSLILFVTFMDGTSRRRLGEDSVPVMNFTCGPVGFIRR